MFDDAPSRVDLRGASKKQDRRALLARAQKEREERELQRKRLRSAVTIQACTRAHLDLKRARAAARGSFDAALAEPFAPRAVALMRALLFFFNESTDAMRLHQLLALLLQSALADAAGNACTLMCATEGGAGSWQHLSRRLIELCLPRLLPPRASPDGVELQAVLYLTDSSRWQWVASLAPERAAVVAALAQRSLLELGRRGLHGAIAAALHALLPALTHESVRAPPTPESPSALLLGPLLSVSMRQLMASCAGAASLGAAVLAGLDSFRREMLCAPGLLSRVPHALLRAALPPAALSSLLRSLALAAPRLPVLPNVAADAVVDGLPPLVAFCGSLVHLVSVCGRDASSGLALGDALPAYIELLHGCVAPFVTHAQSRSGAPSGSRGAPAEDSDEEAAPMELDGAGGSLSTGAGDDGAAALRETVTAQLAELLGAEHIGALWLSLLAPTATDAELRCVPLLSHIFCLLRHGPEGAAADGSTARRGVSQARAAAALSAVSFLPESVPRLWQLAQQHRRTWDGAEGGAVLWAFCAAFSHLLVTLDDAEFFDGERPFGATALRAICTTLKDSAIAAHWQAPQERARQPLVYVSAATAAATAAAAPSSGPPAALRISLLRLLHQLFDRDARAAAFGRTPFMGGAEAWFAEAARQTTVEAVATRMDPDLLQHVASEGVDDAAAAVAAAAAAAGAGPSGIGVAGGLASASELPEARRVASVLLHMPFTLPFDARLRILRHWLLSSRDAILAERMLGPPPNVITIRRESLLMDSYAELRGLGSQMRQPLRVTFIGPEGLEEAGLGEGVAKEFLVELLREGFSPQTGLFVSGAEGTLFPNPAAHLRVGRDALPLFELLGAVLGKALYEGILVELPLAGFFLNRLLGRTNTINDMPSLDPQLFSSLMFLKTFDGDFDSLALNFAVEEFTSDDVPPAQRRQVELKPRGADVAVTRANRLEYIFCVARYRLNAQIWRATSAFMRGFGTVVPPTWINMFSPAELQLVLGGSDAPLDVDDWQAHANYSGGFHADHPTILWFWQALREFDAPSRAATLKFVSSCSRPPLLGFRYQQPMFCIHKAHDVDRMPTSATCMNLLKLPPYDSYETLRDKLKYAIEAGCGFELS